MRLVLRLVLASLSATVTVLAIYAYISISAHRQSLVADMQVDHRAVVGVLVEAIGTVAERHGLEQAQHLVEDINRRKDNILIEWHLEGGHASQAEQTTHLIIDEGEPGGEPRLETRAQVSLDGGVAGTLVIVESLAAGEQVLQGRVVRIGVTALIMLVSGTLVGAAAGVVLVGRRINAMVDHARSVAEGDLDRRIERVGGDDELGRLGREMNAMTDKLAEARRQLRAETAGRLRAQEQLRHGERLMTVGKLAAGLAHELGTPLNVVTESAKMIARRETTEPETVEYAQIVVEQGERMTRILGQLMEFARRRAPKREDAELQVLVESTAALLRPLADKRAVSITVEGSGPFTAHVDAGQIQQVLTNLIVNAIQASPRGGRVDVTVDHAMLRHPERPDEPKSRWLCIDVRDEGEGISSENLPHVFEPFFTTKDVGSGTGLGLSVAYGLVEEHGGWIEAESPPGRGATFRLAVPIANASARAPSA
ncbi:sensor histidine kinase [Paraliomyxa miuraensis]|uniref:sensor histidine kinase n=1 Tax=Paraliomyxa miuraensis TaxID=376150 RepID=UPI00225B48EC|nr:HAMP domain-containing sensor histidine kinase [Paraliomyxa miuraensis]MCX4244319.1 ATP-binding protein [Paraliomyxa miuraensis]